MEWYRKRGHLFETVVVEFRAEVGVAASNDEDAVGPAQAEVHQLKQVVILAIPYMAVGGRWH